jgi:hypothetical protein
MKLTEGSLNYKQPLFLFILLLFFNFSQAQLARSWPRTAIFPYILKGPVKSWKLIGENGVLRTQEYSKEGQLIKDESVNHPADFSQYTFPFQQKAEFEKVYSDTTSFVGIKVKYNERFQIIEKKIGKNKESSLFDEKGNILVHKTKQTKEHLVTDNSRGPIIPPYKYEENISTVTIFKYNDQDSLIEFEHINSNPYHNYRVVYIRDSSDYLVEKLTYDHYDVAVYDDDYVDQIFDKVKDNQFDINTIYKEFWTSQIYASPSRETFKNDSLGRPIEYIVYGNKGNPSFKANWEYKGDKLIRETHFDFYHNKTSAILEYDEWENVVKETVIYGDRQYLFSYEIEYYD